MLRFCAIVAALLLGSLAVLVRAQRTPADGVYTSEQAAAGQALYKERCASCHGAALEGGAAPPLAGDDFLQTWSAQTLGDLVSKIQKTMPANDPGKLTREETVAIVAYLLQAGRFPAGRAALAGDEGALKQIMFPERRSAPPAATAAAGAQPVSSPPLGNMAQLMRGILFPSSNLIFTVQGQDPGAPKPPYMPGSGGFNWADWGAGIYSGWEIVDYAAVAVADVAPLLLLPRRCENGRPAPVDRADWVKYTQELADAGRAVYKASQTRNQEAVSDATNQLADSCLNCHVAYRDRPGGPAGDPSNKAGRCVP
jgi:S-disulfanyl-L-cysteine oxidoreductase SoxD